RRGATRRPRVGGELLAPRGGRARRGPPPRRAARGGAPPARRAAASRPGPSRAGADEPRRRCPRDRRVLPRARRGGGRLVRRAGVLIPLFSLRGGGWGLGEVPDLGPFAAWARAAGFGVAQILPVLEVSGGQSSPYAAQTAFALDPVYLALDRIEGARRPDDLADLAKLPRVDWGAVRWRKTQALEAAFARLGDLPEEARAWAAGETAWLGDYALFSALHQLPHPSR